MRKVTETRICDRCETALYRDADEWIGAQVVMTGKLAGTGRIAGWKDEYDLCIDCAVELGKWMESAT